MINKALTAGLAGETLSRTITGTSEVSAGRSIIATGSGAGIGYLAASGMALCLETAGCAIATTVGTPVIVPIAVLAAGIALIRSLFD